MRIGHGSNVALYVGWTLYLVYMFIPFPYGPGKATPGWYSAFWTVFFGWAILLNPDSISHVFMGLSGVSNILMVTTMILPLDRKGICKTLSFLMTPATFFAGCYAIAYVTRLKLPSLGIAYGLWLSSFVLVTAALYWRSEELSAPSHKHLEKSSLRQARFVRRFINLICLMALIAWLAIMVLVFPLREVSHMKINSFPFWYGLLLPIGIFGLYGILKDHFASKASAFNGQPDAKTGAATDGPRSLP